MSQKKFKVKIESKGIKVGNDDYEIRTEDKKEYDVEFEKGEKDELSKNNLKLEYKKKSDKTWTKFERKVKYTGGFFFDDIELEDKKLNTTLEAKDSIKMPVGFFSSMKWPTYLIIVVFVIGIIALIWWWVASSRSEDKEEEGL